MVVRGDSGGWSELRRALEAQHCHLIMEVRIVDSIWVINLALCHTGMYICMTHLHEVGCLIEVMGPMFACQRNSVKTDAKRTLTVLCAYKLLPYLKMTWFHWYRSKLRSNFQERTVEDTAVPRNHALQLQRPTATKVQTYTPVQK